MSERYLCTICKLYTNSLCRQRAGLEVLMKVASRLCLKLEASYFKV